MRLRVAKKRLRTWSNCTRRDHELRARARRRVARRLRRLGVPAPVIVGVLRTAHRPSWASWAAIVESAFEMAAAAGKTAADRALTQLCHPGEWWRAGA